MPTYEYKCSSCGHSFDEFQPISAEPLSQCPACGKQTLKRLIGGGAGMIFRGSGFYLTDYKKNGKDKTFSRPTKKKDDGGAKKETTTAGEGPSPKSAPKTDSSS